MSIYLKSASIKRSAFLFAFILSCTQLWGQNTEELHKTTTATLLSLFNYIQQHTAEPDKVNQANSELISAFENFLKQKDAFDYRFDLEKNLSDLISEDKKVRVISWTLPPDVGVYRSFGFVLHKDKKTKSTRVFKLKEQTEKVKDPEKKVFKADNWPGAVYYNLVQKKYKGKAIYTLFGWSGNDGITTKKMIDVLSFSSKGEPVFGAPVFQLRKLKQQRVIFEYSPQVVMYLNYDKDKNMILFDHLSPDEPGNTGRFQYYGPDFKIDGFQFKKGMWILVEDLDVTNKN